MLYWPTSLFLGSPFLTAESKQQLLMIGQPGAMIFESTLVACHQVASQNPCRGTSLTTICNEGTPLRRAYLKYPSDDEWTALERGGFVSDGINFGFTLDALH